MRTPPRTPGTALLGTALLLLLPAGAEAAYDGGVRSVELGDAQRAIRTVRARADELRIDPKRVGILGFSAGGHLASTAGTHFDAGQAGAADPIDRAGCRGMTLGGAQVSEKHCNFLLNLGSATSADIEALGEEVRRRVMARCNISLEWEIQRIGVVE